LNELIAIPTVEQINLEHRLANNKATEAVQHATNCGLMLLQVKASLSHGEWLPWLQDAIDRNELKVGLRQSRKYMQLAANMHCEAHLLEAPSINAALELLTDKEPAEPQGELIDGEAERQARIVAEQQTEAERAARITAEADKATEQHRNAEWAAQSNSQRQHIEALERRIDVFDAQPKPKPIKIVERIEVIPADYEALKAKAAQLETELATNKAEQTRIIQSAIKAKMSGYQGEVDALEAKKRNLEQQAKEYQDYLASLTGKVKQMESQARAFEKTRQALVDLASELRDFAPIDPDLTRKALALAEMTHDATNTLRLVFEPARPELTLIQGTAA
jgi:myosin heavy subunit